MICDRCNMIEVRKRDGRRMTIFRCADPHSTQFTQNVTEETCLPCPSYQAALEAQAAQAVRETLPAVPSLAKRVKSWTAAVADWKLQGSPERSKDEVQQIFNTFCTPCSWYDRNRQLCRGCGCRVRSGGYAVFNKIRMATQHCPRNLW